MAKIKEKRPTRDLRIEKVPLEHVLLLKQKAAARDSNVAKLIREMIEAAVK